MDDGEDTLATYPRAILMLDATVIENCSFIKVYTATMNGFGKNDLISMEKVPTRVTFDFVSRIPEDVLDTV